MFTRNKIRNSIALTLASLSLACSQAADQGVPANDWQAPELRSPAVASFDDYKAEARRAAGESHGFIVESDLFFPTEAGLRAYYEKMYVEPVDKSIINKVGGVWDKRSTPLNIKYCFSAGWGQAQSGYTAPALNPVRTAIQQAMAAWEGVARVRFTYLSNLDGATCTTSGANPGVDFVVTHYSSTTTAVGPFPSNPWADQKLKVPTSGIGRLLAIHEVGHALGFRHEHIHSGASPNCAEGGSWEELTAFDTASCMKYSNCTVSGAINGTEISMLDGVGVRKVYGSPDWWWPVAAYSVL